MSSRKRSLTISTEERLAPADAGDKTEEDGEPLSPVSRMFHQPHFNLYIVAIMGSGKTINVEAVKAGLESTLVLHPRFSSIMARLIILYSSILHFTSGLIYLCC